MRKAKNICVFSGKRSGVCVCVSLREREQHTQKSRDGKDVEEMKGQGGQPVVNEGS